MDDCICDLTILQPCSYRKGIAKFLLNMSGFYQCFSTSDSPFSSFVAIFFISRNSSHLPLMPGVDGLSRVWILLVLQEIVELQFCQQSWEASN